jgi:tetratricopeptide (TPR) repeat protein
MRLVVVLAVLGGSVGWAAAETAAVDKPSFTATPAELLAAAKTKPAGTEDAFILREESQTTFDDAGRSTYRSRRIFVITSQAGADDWGWMSVVWTPTYQDKPTFRARVISPSGAVVEVAPNQITEKPVTDSIRRQLEVQLSTLVIGSIVEEEVTTVDREPMIGGGDIDVMNITDDVPIVSLRATFEAPAKRKLHIVTRGTVPKPQREIKAGKQRVIYSAANLAPSQSYEGSLPLGETNYASISASGAESWGSVVRAYRGELAKRTGQVTYPANIAKAATLETASALLAWLQTSIRREPRLLHGSALLPALPADVVKAGVGEDIDRAALLVALLGQAGIAAELAFVADEDADPVLVSLDAFDRVIVRATVAGKPVWIDPSERGARVGQLVDSAQGRHALVIAAATTGLVITPTSTAQDNVAREVRTYELQESGPTKIVEVSTLSGAFEPAERDWIRDSSPDQVRKRLASYVKDAYVDAKLDDIRVDADNLAKPYEMTLVISNARRAYTNREDAEIYLFPTDVLTRLPYELGNASKDPKVRKHDLALRTWYSEVIENRVVIPTGFAVPTPAAEKTRTLGALKLVETQRRDGNMFIVTWRLEIPKARFSPAEVTATQKAIGALRAEPGEHFVFDLVALSLAAKGKYRDAIAEGQRLIKLHPKESLHQLQLATVLLKTGAGEAARRAGKKAVEIEPTNADAFSMYAWVLSHDTFGHWHGFDYDHAAALAALAKARKLDPKHLGAARQLAGLLERGANGKLYDNANDTTRALAAWRDANALDPNDQEIGGSLIKLLLFKGEAAEAEAVARKLPANDNRNSLLVAAVAIGKGGPQAAITLASNLASGDARTKLIAAAAGQLMFTRHYDEMRAMYAEAPIGNPQFDTILKAMRRVDTSKLGGEPEDVARAVLIAIARDEYVAPTFTDKQLGDEFRQSSGKILSRMGMDDKIAAVVVQDMLLAVLRMDVKRENGLARVELDQAGAKSQFYMVLGKKGARLIGANSTASAIGRYLLATVSTADEKTSATLLDWIVEDLRRVNPSMASGLKSFWGTGLPRTKPAMEVVAAVIANGDDAKSIAALKRCNTTVTTANAQYVCDWVLANAYGAQANWAELDDHARDWMTRSKQEPTAVATRARALGHLGKFDEAEQILADALKTDPDDRALLMTQIELAWGRHQPAQARQRSDALAARSDATPADLNNAAWSDLIEGGDLATARQIVERALQIENKSSNLLNTAAAIEAEQGDLAASHGHVEAGRDSTETPSSGDWYVHGRILEQLGFPDDAIASYRKIKASKAANLLPDSSELAKKRLTKLGVKK